MQALLFSHLHGAGRSGTTAVRSAAAAAAAALSAPWSAQDPGLHAELHIWDAAKLQHLSSAPTHRRRLRAGRTHCVLCGAKQSREGRG